jgi:hypothetical protein
MLRVLIGCERFGRVRDAFRALGHEAYSCDVEPDVNGSPFHWQGDVLPWLDWGWDIVICFPPCTFIAQSAVHLLKSPARVRQMKAGAHFFRQCLGARARIGVGCENPIMCRRAQEIIGSNWTQLVQPWQFGDAYTKKTGLWLRGLPPLKPTRIVEPRKGVIENMGADPRDKSYRQRMRSITPVGLAQAMAAQWGGLN